MTQSRQDGDIRVAAMQCANPAGGLVDQIDRLQHAADEAARAGATLLMTPELYSTGYGDAGRTRGLAKDDAMFLRACAEIARSTGIDLLVGHAEPEGAMLYNSATAFDAHGNRLVTYRKRILANDYERACFTTGIAPALFRHRGVLCGILICYDVEFPEQVRELALMGAEVVLVPTALTTRWTVVSQNVVPSRAYENGVFLAYANFAGSEDYPTFAGCSHICGPGGETLALGGSGVEMIQAHLDLPRIVAARAAMPLLADITKHWRAISMDGPTVPHHG